MASKQIGKLRQRIGELVLRQDKTTATDDFKELENDVAIRAAGLEKLSFVSDAYIKALSKKKDLDGDASKDKGLPIEALGLAMIAHGDEFGESSIYGSALVHFGRVHCKIASLQEDYATGLQDTYFRQLEDGILTIQEYRAQRKKLESRRLTLDSMIAKLAKAKKEKDKTEAEEEMEIARIRYEEMSEEVHDRMISIQQREHQQFSELTEFLDLEISFVSAYHEMLRKLKEEWPESAAVDYSRQIQHKSSSHMFPRDPTTPILASGSPSESYNSATFSTSRYNSKKMNMNTAATGATRDRARTMTDAPPPPLLPSSASSSTTSSSRPSLPRSFTHTNSHSNRGTGHVRRRSDSLATTDTGVSGRGSVASAASGDTTSATSISGPGAVGAGVSVPSGTSTPSKETNGGNSNGKEKEKGSISKRLSVSGWMDSLGSSRSRKNSSSAGTRGGLGSLGNLGSLSVSGKGKSKSKNFQTLEDDEDAAAAAAAFSHEGEDEGKQMTPRPAIPSRAGSTLREKTAAPPPPPPPRRSNTFTGSGSLGYKSGSARVGAGGSSNEHYEYDYSSNEVDEEDPSHQHHHGQGREGRQGRGQDAPTKSIYDPSAPPIRVRALYDFSNPGVDELGFRRGEKLVLRAEMPSGYSSYSGGGGSLSRKGAGQAQNAWIWAERDEGGADGGAVGLIPLNYVEVLPGGTGSSTGTAAGTGAGRTSPSKKKIQSQTQTPSRSRAGSRAAEIREDLEDSDSPSSSLLQDVLHRPTPNSRSRRPSLKGNGRAQSSPELHRFPGTASSQEDGQDGSGDEDEGEPFGDHAYDYEYDEHRSSHMTVRAAPSPIDALSNVLVGAHNSSPNVNNNLNASTSTSIRPPPPPIPSRPSISTKKPPPPPPPPARRAQSSMNLHVHSGTSANSSPVAVAPHLALPPVPSRGAAGLGMKERRRSVVEDERSLVWGNEGEEESPFGS